MSQTVFIILSGLVVSIGYFLIKKKLGITYHSETPIYKHINRFHKIGELIIIAVSLIIMCLMWFVFELRLANIHDIFLMLAFLYIFRTVMEWRYNRSSRHHIISAYSSVCLILIFLGIELFY
jgi:predicted ABC-type exoprotein transport system permease subunit